MGPGHAEARPESSSAQADSRPSSAPIEKPVCLHAALLKMMSDQPPCRDRLCGSGPRTGGSRSNGPRSTPLQPAEDVPLELRHGASALW